jgi:GDPmannose 4,6-dehydratase
MKKADAHRGPPNLNGLSYSHDQDRTDHAELLLAKNYQVHGIVRRASLFNTDRIDHLHVGGHPNPNFHLHYGDLSDAGALRNVLDVVQPDEVYNLGAQSHVRVSFDQPEYTVDVTAVGVIRLLEAIRSYSKHNNKQIRFYQASSSEMFGSAKPRQHEGTRFEPRSPYACAKVYAHYQVINHREGYGMFACSGILFNHESPRRGETFVTRKITRAATRIKLGLQDKLFLGNLEARRDWGFAGDYVEAMWMMLQQDQADDYVISTGITHSVRELVETAFAHAGLDWNKHVKLDPKLIRPAEVEQLIGDNTKARKALGWAPKVDFTGLVKMMVDADIARVAAEARPVERSAV